MDLYKKNYNHCNNLHKNIANILTHSARLSHVINNTQKYGFYHVLIDIYTKCYNAIEVDKIETIWGQLQSLCDTVIRDGNESDRIVYILDLLCQSISNSFNTLVDIEMTCFSNVHARLIEANSIITQIYETNLILLSPTTAGQERIVLLDTRNGYIEVLSSLINIQYIINENDTVNIYAECGANIITDNEHNYLQLHIGNNAKKIAIIVLDNHSNIKISEGRIGGFLTGILAVQNIMYQLDHLVRLLVANLNVACTLPIVVGKTISSDLLAIDPHFAFSNGIVQIATSDNKYSAAFEKIYTLEMNNKNIFSLVLWINQTIPNVCAEFKDHELVIQSTNNRYIFLESTLISQLMLTHVFTRQNECRVIDMTTGRLSIQKHLISGDHILVPETLLSDVCENNKFNLLQILTQNILKTQDLKYNLGNISNIFYNFGTKIDEQMTTVINHSFIESIKMLQNIIQVKRDEMKQLLEICETFLEYAYYKVTLKQDDKIYELLHCIENSYLLSLQMLEVLEKTEVCDSE